jgi:hypothetical protein
MENLTFKCLGIFHEMFFFLFFFHLMCCCCCCSLIVVIIAGYPSSWMRVPVSLLIVCYNKMYTCAWVYYLLRQLLCILFVYGCRLLSCLSSSSYDYCCYCHVLAAPALETMSIYRCTVYIYFCVF